MDGIRTDQLPKPTAQLTYENTVTPAAPDDLVSEKYITDIIASVKSLPEDISGQINGVTNTFTTGAAYASTSMIVFHDGKKLKYSRVTELTPTTFQLDFVPSSGELIARYRPNVALTAGHVFGMKTRVILGSTRLTAAQLENGFFLVDTTAGNVTITLPPVGSDDVGVHCVFMCIGSNTLTVARGDDETLDGATTIVLSENESVELIYTDVDDEWILIIIKDSVAVDVTVQDPIEPTSQTMEADVSTGSTRQDAGSALYSDLNVDPTTQTMEGNVATGSTRQDAGSPLYSDLNVDPTTQTMETDVSAGSTRADAGYIQSTPFDAADVSLVSLEPED